MVALVLEAGDGAHRAPVDYGTDCGAEGGDLSVHLAGSVVLVRANMGAMFGEKYASPAEEVTCFANFQVNMRKAAVQQASEPLATFGMSLFSDLLAAEFFEVRVLQSLVMLLQSLVVLFDS